MLEVMINQFEASLIDPEELGPLKIIVDAANNQDYFNVRAQEYLKLALTALTIDQKHKYLDMAMNLVILGMFEDVAF